MSSYKAKQMIVMRRDLKMRKGKIAAQAGHACVEATLIALAKAGRLEDVRVTPDDNWVYLQKEAPQVRRGPLASLFGSRGESVVEGNEGHVPIVDWFEAGVAKVCVYVDSEEELLELAARGREQGFVSALIRDSGRTEFHGEATYTCLAFEPLYPEQIDPLTGDLPLY